MYKQYLKYLFVFVVLGNILMAKGCTGAIALGGAALAVLSMLGISVILIANRK